MAELDAAAPVDERFDDPRRSFIAALDRGDAVAAASVYASDGRLLLPSTTPLDGRPSIEAFWRTGLDAGLAALELVPDSIDPQQTFACEVGAYTLRSAPAHEASVSEHGRYLIVHRLEQDGTWRRALELYSPDHEAAENEPRT
jgi:ketosteroid isomerase-like protein